MRSKRRSLKREQTRSKIREKVQQHTRNLVEEFGLDPNTKYSILYDVDFSPEELDMASSIGSQSDMHTMTK